MAETQLLHPLAQFRRDNRLTAEQFAERIKVKSPITIYRYEKGLRVPRPKVMSRITLETGGKLTANDFPGSAE